MNTGLSVPVDRRRFGSGRRRSRPSKYGRALRFPFTSRWMLSSASLWTVTTSSSRIIHSRCPLPVNVCAGAAVFTPTDPRRLSRRFSGDQRLRYLHSGLESVNNQGNIFTTTLDGWINIFSFQIGHPSIQWTWTLFSLYTQMSVNLRPNFHSFYT